MTPDTISPISQFGPIAKEHPEEPVRLRKHASASRAHPSTSAGCRRTGRSCGDPRGLARSSLRRAASYSIRARDGRIRGERYRFDAEQLRHARRQRVTDGDDSTALANGRAQVRELVGTRIRPCVDISAMKVRTREAWVRRAVAKPQARQSKRPCIRRAVPTDRRARQAAWAMNISGRAHRGSPGISG